MQTNLFAPSPPSLARFSPCGHYRYELRRSIPGATGSGVLPWVMLNPSVADATTNDLTVTKCVGFADRLGFASIVVVNLFAFVATQPLALLLASDPVGPDNDDAIRQAVGFNNLVIVAWGDSIGFGPKMPAAFQRRNEHVLKLLRDRAVDVRCLGVTKSGAPRHPSRLGYNTPLVPFGLK